MVKPWERGTELRNVRRASRFSYEECKKEVMPTGEDKLKTEN